MDKRKLEKAKEYFDQAKPRSKGSVGRESAEKQRDKQAMELKERVLDRKIQYSGEYPEVRYTGRNPGSLRGDVESQVKLSSGDWFDVVKENPRQRETVLQNIVARASDPEKVYTLTDREKLILKDAGYGQPDRAYRSPMNALSDAADAVYGYFNEGRQLPPKMTGSKPTYSKKK